MGKGIFPVPCWWITVNASENTSFYVVPYMYVQASLIKINSDPQQSKWCLRYNQRDVKKIQTKKNDRNKYDHISQTIYRNKKEPSLLVFTEVLYNLPKSGSILKDIVRFGDLFALSCDLSILVFCNLCTT